MNKQKYDFINDDKRILDRNLRRHRLSQQDHQKLLKALPDEGDFGEEHVVYSGAEENTPSANSST